MLRSGTPWRALYKECNRIEPALGTIKEFRRAMCRQPLPATRTGKKIKWLHSLSIRESHFLYVDPFADIVKDRLMSYDVGAA